MKETLEEFLSGSERIDAERLLDEVQETLGKGREKDVPKELWHDFLNASRRPGFLQILPGPVVRNRWAALVFDLIDSSDYGFKTLLSQRVAEHPDRPLFQYFRAGKINSANGRQILLGIFQVNKLVKLKKNVLPPLWAGGSCSPILLPRQED